MRDSNKEFAGEKEAYEKYPELQATVNELVGYDRIAESGLQEESLMEFQHTCRDWAKGDKTAFLALVWTELIRDRRDLVLKSSTTGEIERTERAWKEDGLCFEWEVDFSCLATPAPPTASKTAYQKLLEEEGLARSKKVPRPSLTCGLRVDDAFDGVEQLINAMLGRYTTLSRDLCHAFFIIEAETSEGTIEHAENSCRRGGAALVHSRMKFNAETIRDGDKSGEEELPPGPDLGSIAFSLALVPTRARLFLHWAEGRPKKKCERESGRVGDAKADETELAYHMYPVESYDLGARHDCDILLLQNDVENILNWGAVQRKCEIKKKLRKILKAIHKEDAKVDL